MCRPATSHESLTGVHYPKQLMYVNEVHETCSYSYKFPSNAQYKCITNISIVNDELIQQTLNLEYNLLL